MSIGKLFHVTHVAEDLVALDRWYDRVLAPWRGMMEHHHLPHGEREGSLLVIGDGVIETVAPGPGPGSAAAPLGRFLEKFGRHWHSLAWYCDDVGAAWERLTSQGIRTVTRSGPATTRPVEGDLYTHPKDTSAQLELYQPPAADGGPSGPGSFPDPRFEPGWARRWAARSNPLGIDRLAYVTVVVADLDRAVGVFTNALGGEVIHDAAHRLAGTDCVYVAVGSDTVVELARPTDPRSLAGRDLAAYGDSCHSVAFGVGDLTAAAARLARAGIAVPARDDTTLLTTPRDTFGAAMRFTTETVPGDPRANTTACSGGST